MGWTGLDKSTPLSSGRCLFQAKTILKTLGIPLAIKFISCPPHYPIAGAAPEGTGHFLQSGWYLREMFSCSRNLLTQLSR